MSHICVKAYLFKTFFFSHPFSTEGILTILLLGDFPHSKGVRPPNLSGHILEILSGNACTYFFSQNNLDKSIGVTEKIITLRILENCCRSFTYVTVCFLRVCLQQCLKMLNILKDMSRLPKILNN